VVKKIMSFNRIVKHYLNKHISPNIFRPDHTVFLDYQLTRTRAVSRSQSG